MEEPHQRDHQEIKQNARFPSTQPKASKRRNQGILHHGKVQPRLLLHHLELLQRDQKYQIEMVQQWAARFVTNRYSNISSVSDRLDYLCWESHETRRSKLQLTVLFKIFHGLTDIPTLDDVGKLQSEISPRSQVSAVLYINCSFKLSFFPMTIPMWDRLPATEAEASSLVFF